MRYFFIYYAIIFILLCLLAVLIFRDEHPKPKLLVGIVVDQMRSDYLYRFYDQYGRGGFKRLMRKGFHFRNAHYNYIPTTTAPGHASIYTGTTPRFHGIIGNQWYDRESGGYIYCVGDSTQTAVGGSGENGDKSPVHLISTTLSDQLRLASNFRSKVVSIAIKDRGAILPAGHSANAAYWYDPASGAFISSTYYMENLPEWVVEFNRRELPAQYLKQTWSTLYPIEEYSASREDNNDFERAIGSQPTPAFPYPLEDIAGQNGFGIIPITPFGNSLTLEMALAAIEGESLGQDDFPDLLTVSFSSTDYIGHAYGPQSVELQDTYLRLDEDIERLLDFLDSEVGHEDYAVCLTADHAVMYVPSYLETVKIKGGYYDSNQARAYLNAQLTEQFGEGEWLLNVSGHQLFINRELVLQSGYEPDYFQNQVAAILLRSEKVFEVYTADQLIRYPYEDGMAAALRNGYNRQRSGDVMVVMQPNYLGSRYGTRGTTHGSGFNYDTHVPLLFYGTNIPRGNSVRRVSITDIAPSLSLKLGVGLPNASTGRPLTELFD